jgi:glucose/arabinose dehydrogenase
MNRAQTRVVTIWGAVVLAVAAVAVGVVIARHGTGSDEALRLPDLDQETPTQLDVREQISGGRRSYLLGFRSAIRNVGDGPLIIEGHRSEDSATMSADQLIDTETGSNERVAGVGELSFVTSADHDHWHYAGFDRYELRRAGNQRVMVQDRKSGFCLGDRYQVTTRILTGAAADPVYTQRCGLNRPDLTSLVEGISVGYGDDYAAYLEYQDLPLDGVPAGRYVLVHRVNTDRSLRELSYANNAASVLLDLHWRDGKPSLRVLATCQDTDRCDRQVRVQTVATGLEIPWDIAFMPDGRALVTERPGRVRLLNAGGGLQPEPVARIAVAQQGEGGLLGLVLDPDFSTNQLVYLYFTGTDGMLLERWRWTGSRLVRQVTLVDAIESGEVHDSGRIAFGPDDRLYVATGDAGKPELAQDPDSLNGKFLALTPEQYRGSSTVRPAVVATGLRNSQGFDWQPGTGALIANDHGPTGFDGPEGYDEVNQIVAGGNYGWPEVISNDTDDGKYLAPLRVYREPIAPSGATFLTRPDSPWQGNYVLAALRGEELRRLVLENGRIVADEPLLEGQFGRLRTVKEGPDGDLYVLTSNRDGRGTPRPRDDRILRVRLPRR